MSPFYLGLVSPWAWGMWSVLIGGSLVVQSLQFLKDGSLKIKDLKAIGLPVGMFIAVLLWCVFQILPGVPESWVHPIWQAAFGMHNIEPKLRISVNPEKTMQDTLRLLAYGAVFFAAYCWARDRKKARQIINALVGAGLAYSVYGLLIQFSDAQMILWFEKTAYVKDLTSTFVNRNTYATYAGMVLICSSALLFETFSRGLETTLPLKERIRSLLIGLDGRGWFLLVSWVVVLTALLSSHSRAGFVSTLVGMVVLLFAVKQTHTHQKSSGVILLVGLSVGVGVLFLISGEILGSRLLFTSLNSDSRPIVYSLTFNAALERPIWGTGLGTFPDVFRAIRTEDLPKFFLQAHNTYLELFLELGAVGALLMMGVFASLGTIFVRGVVNRRRDVIFPAIGISATFLVGAHSLVDFSMQIPAIPMTYSLIAGTACAQSFSSRS